MNAAGRLTRPYCQWWQTRKALDHSTEGFMEVVHEEYLYQHELNRIYHTDSNFHLKGILNQKMTSWRSKPVFIAEIVTAGERPYEGH